LKTWQTGLWQVWNPTAIPGCRYNLPLDAQVMRLNKMGTFSMAQLGQSKSAIAKFVSARRNLGLHWMDDAEAITDAAQSAEVSANGQSTRCP